MREQARLDPLPAPDARGIQQHEPGPAENVTLAHRGTQTAHAIPLFRFGFPIFDRVNLHRYPLIGYQGVINMVTTICNKFIDITDDTCDDRHFEMMR